MATIAAPVVEGVSRTPRVERLRDEFLDSMLRLSAERSRIYTDYFRQSEGEPIALRRALGFQRVLEGMAIRIREGELVVGSQTEHVRGCSAYPEFSAGWIANEMATFSSREGSTVAVSEADQAALLEDIRYWEGRSVQDRTKSLWHNRWGDRVEEAVEAGVMFDFTPYQQSRYSVDYAKVLNRGLEAVIEEAREKLAQFTVQSNVDLQRAYFWQSVIVACEGVISLARRYSRLASDLARREGDPGRGKELEEIAAVCDWVPAKPARTFREAVQSFWFTHLAVEIENCGPGYTSGRFDQYMYPFYRKDIDEGRITREEAAELLQCLWLKHNELNVLWPGRYQEIAGTMGQNVAIGGQTPEGRDATNELSYLILDVAQAVKMPQPTISLRYHDGAPQELLIRAAEMVRSGGGMPAWFNDKTSIASLALHGVPLKEARDWVPIG